MVSLAAQLPFWFLRFFFGWQFVLGQSEPRESFSLRDIFVFTFLCAFGFAAPQIASNLMPDTIGYSTDSYERIERIEHPDGSVEYESVVLTDPEEIELWRREQRQRNRYQMSMGFASTGATAFVISLLSLPTVIMMFKSQEVGTGCAFILAYAGVWFVLFIIVVLVFAGGFGPGGAEAFGYLFFVLASYATCIGGSIAISRDHGFRLTLSLIHI